ncbi:hypothetical protein J3R83DRAFT_292 [Lanmaoa asiatica]|nr:hypothetical protein J3R83DRAFT_292 [Lanmaoa asiatica]
MHSACARHKPSENAAPEKAGSEYPLDPRRLPCKTHYGWGQDNQSQREKETENGKEGSCQIHRLPKSTSSSSSSDASTPSKKTVTIAVQQPKSATSENADGDENEDEMSSSSSDESQDNSDTDEENADIPVPSSRPGHSEPPLQRDSPSPQPNVDIPPFIPPNALESEQALKERFRKFWMASIAEGFKDDLEEIRKVCAP